MESNQNLLLLPKILPVEEISRCSYTECILEQSIKCKCVRIIREVYKQQQY